MIQNEKVSVYYGTKDAYEFEKQNKRIDENALYFIEGVLYSGYELYSKDYKRVTELPDVGQSNVIYINTIDSSVSIWNEEQNEWIYICKPLSNEVVDDGATIATSAAVYKSLETAKQYADGKCEEVVKEMNLEVENSIMENNRNLFLGTSDKYNSIADICDALDSMSTVENSRYTNEEIDNKFSAFETNIDWKEAVNTYNDIATTYPNPEDGWTVSAKDDDCIYRYNGTGWVEISAGVIPKATSSNDGLLSKENYSKLSGISSGAEVNQNAFSNVVVGSTTITADAKTDTLTLVAGDNVTITSNENGNEITISIAEYASLSETETDALI